MIIFGTRGVTLTKAEGDFHCPQCNSPRSYRHRKVRRFFTLYFIPVIPLDSLGEYIECGSCRNTYNMGVLDYHPGKSGAEIEAEYLRGVRLCMIEMVLADGNVEDAEVQQLMAVYKKVTGQDLDEAQLRDEIGKYQSQGSYVKEQLGQLAGSLNDDGKELIIKAGFLVAAADGEFHESEQELLTHMAISLGISKNHLNAILKDLTSD